MVKHRLWAAAAAVTLSIASARAADAPLSADVFATIGSVKLSAQDFQAAYAVAARTKFYHSKPPEAEIAKFQREVGEDLVARVLVVEEAKKRGIAADPAFVKNALARFEARSRHSEGSPEQRQRALATMTEQFENQSRYQQLEKKIRDVPLPAERASRDYYERHKEQFVEPEQIRLSVILLKVDPGAPKATWDAARKEAADLHKRLSSGANFAELARMRSADQTADKGGDMGYLHKGMLPDGIAQVVDGMKAGDLSEPLTLLEGVAIIRLVDRKQARQRSFEDVRKRAAELAQRDESEARWAKFVADLRKATPVRINDSLYLPLVAAAPAAPPAKR